MRTAVVILNWNTRDHLRKWLPSLISSCEGRDAAVIVADNHSTDGSVEMLSEEFPQVRRITFSENFGFTGGYNRALEQTEAEFYVLVNSDVEVGRDWLDPLVKWMDSHPECGVCGPKILSMNGDGRFEYAGAAGGYLDFFGFPFCRGRALGATAVDRGQFDSPAPVSWVSGAALMVRSSLWKELGGLDERFFAHMEEIDFCWRAICAGHEVWNIPQSAVRHLGGGTLPQSSPHKLYLNVRNNLLMLDGNLPAAGKWLIPVRILLDLGAAAFWFVTFKPEKGRSVIRAHKSYRKLRSRESGGKKINLLSRRLLAIEYLKLL